MMEGSIPSSSSLSTPTPTSSSSPAASSLFRPRRSEDWNRFRPFIEQLYRDDQLKLRDVKRIMEREHRFVASEKQYKDRLAAWNIRKNIKAKEVNIMIRKQQKRAARGKQTVFRVAGQKVDTKRIARFVRRYGPNLDSNEPHPIEPHRDSPEPATPSDMSYYTPEPDERAITLSPLPDNHPHTCETPDFASFSFSRHNPPEHTVSGRVVVNRDHSVDNLDSIPDSELDDTKSPPVTLSPTISTNDTPTPFDSIQPLIGEDENPWGSLGAFQQHLKMLGKKLDEDTSRFFPVDDSRLQQN